MIDFENESRELVVDGQLIPVPSQDEWNAILETGMYLGVPAVLPDEKRSMVSAMDFVKRHQQEFCLGFICFTPRKTSRIMLMLCWKDGEWHRAHIETVDCKNCDWRGDIANPAVPDIYFGAPDSRAALMRGYDLSGKKCPKCGKESLPRRAIWTEKYTEDKDAT